MDRMGPVTHILSAIEQGDPHAASQLLPLVYDELRKLAAQKLSRESPGQTLEATALVHEAYLRLVGPLHPNPSPVSGEGQERGVHWASRGHFFAAAAEAMRRILVDNARRKRRPKHGGDKQRVDADLNLLAAYDRPIDLLALDDALTRLAEQSPARAEVVKLRYFAGLTVPEAAHILGISVATAERHWTYARTWLYAELSESNDWSSEKSRDE